jgi:hypothetical protein
MQNKTTKLYHGGCHCGGVAFSVEAPLHLEVLRCNCSMCQKTGFEHLIVPKNRFHLQQGDDLLTTYSFHTHTAKHLFCQRCGVKSFYVPRSNPDGFSVNVRCLDPTEIDSISYDDFDGQNWEQHAASLAHLSQNENKAD